MFVDSHAHLDGSQFDSDREKVIACAREAGVRTIVAIGNGDGPPHLDAGIQLAEKHPFMYATIGIHPHEARLADDAAYSTMEQLARHPKVIAWGEIGLDYHYDHSPRETQKQVFTRQMELAAAVKERILQNDAPDVIAPAAAPAAAPDVASPRAAPDVDAPGVTQVGAAPAGGPSQRILQE